MGRWKPPATTDPITLAQREAANALVDKDEAERRLELSQRARRKAERALADECAERVNAEKAFLHKIATLQESVESEATRLALLARNQEYLEMAIYEAYAPGLMHISRPTADEVAELRRAEEAIDEALEAAHKQFERDKRTKEWRKHQ